MFYSWMTTSYTRTDLFFDESKDSNNLQEKRASNPTLNLHALFASLLTLFLGITAILRCLLSFGVYIDCYFIR